MTVFLIFCSFQIAKAEQLKPLEVELKRLEDLSDQIVSDFKYMRKREEEMRDTNGGAQCSHCCSAALCSQSRYCKCTMSRCRIDPLEGLLLQPPLHGLPPRSGNLASALPASLLQVEKLID